MDIELRREVRARLTELEDRVKRLEEAQSTADAQSSDPAPADSKTKKTAAEPTSAEKDTN